MHIVGLSVIEGTLDTETVQAFVASRLDRIPKYRQRLKFVPFNIAQPVLADAANFVLEEHITFHELDQGTSLDDAIALAQKIAAKPLDRTRPLWAMHVITGFGQSLLVHISHLALMEGMSLGDDAHVFFDLQRDPRIDDTPAWQPRPEPTGVELVAAAVRENTTAFGERTRRIRNIQDSNSELLRRATESITRFITEPLCSPPWNGGFVGTERLFRAVAVPYVDVRQIRRRFGGTDNDVVLAVLAEAAALYMQARGLAVEGQHLRILCPVKVRREDDNGVRGTRMSGIFPFLNAEPMGIAERLEQVRWETESIKQNREAQSLQLLSELTPPLPPIPDLSGFSLPGSQARVFNLMDFNPARFFAQFAPSQINLPGLDAINNMAGFNFSCLTSAGANTTVHFAGHETKAQMLVPPLAANLGLGVAVSTYAQTLTFNLVADANLMPDLDAFADHVQALVTELKNHVGDAAA